MRKQLLPLATAALITAFIAPDISAREAPTLEEIVVTARKRVESLQETPVSVTAFGSDELDNMGVVDFEDIQKSNPNVVIVPQRGVSAVSQQIAIRGNVQTSSIVTVDESVGVYVDGVIHARSYGTGGVMYDLESVQTLKGPQGTLFGRNTTGGAVLIKTKDPELEDFGGTFKVSFGERGTQEYFGVLNIPLSNKFAVRLVHTNVESDGYVELDSGRELGDRETEMTRAKLLWQPTDSTRAVFTVERIEQVGTAPLSGPAPASVYDDPEYDNLSSALYTSSNLNDADIENYRLVITQQMKKGELKLLAGRREYDVFSDLGLLPVLGHTLQSKPDNDDTSVELQFNGNFLDGKLDLASGVFYFDETVHEDAFVELDLLIGSGAFTAVNYIEVNTESKSAYLQPTYHITDKFDVTLGARYTDDEKDASLLKEGTLPFFDYKLSEEEFNYLISASYRFTDELMGYISTGTGYRAGGPSFDRLTLPDGTLTDEILGQSSEEVTNYEIGLKSNLLNRRVRLNAVIFSQDYKDYQYVQNEPYTQIVDGQPVTSSRRIVRNSDAVIQGAEVELTALLPAEIEISLTYGYTKAEVDESGNFNDGDVLPQIPENTWSLNAKKTFAVGDSEILLNANYSYRDEYTGNLDQEITPTLDEDANSIVDEIGLLNITANFSIGNWKVGAYVRNATDEEYVTYKHYSANGAINQVFVGAPRTAGFNVTFSF